MLFGYPKLWLNPECYNTWPCYWILASFWTLIICTTVRERKDTRFFDFASFGLYPSIMNYRIHNNSKPLRHGGLVVAYSARISTVPFDYTMESTPPYPCVSLSSVAGPLPVASQLMASMNTIMEHFLTISLLKENWPIYLSGIISPYINFTSITHRTSVTFYTEWLKAQQVEKD